MVQPSANKNIWVASSDGDIERVKYLIEHENISPNAKDANSYTPMHAAASYHHFELLTYLLSVGGDINVLDAEGETPLFTVESVEAARWLVEHGADVLIQNEEGQTAAEYLEDDHPEISAYLNSLTSPSSSSSSNPADPALNGADSKADRIADRETDELILEAQRIMAEAQRTGEDPEGRLREIVEEAVKRGVSLGAGLDGVGEEGRKRSKREEEGMDGA